MQKVYSRWHETTRASCVHEELLRALEKSIKWIEMEIHWLLLFYERRSWWIKQSNRKEYWIYTEEIPLNHCDVRKIIDCWLSLTTYETIRDCGSWRENSVELRMKFLGKKFTFHQTSDFLEFLHHLIFFFFNPLPLNSQWWNENFLSNGCVNQPVTTLLLSPFQSI